MRPYASVPALLLALGMGVAPALAAGSRPAKTIGDLADRPVEIRRNATVEGSAARAMDNYRKFLELQQTDPKLRAEALRRLGDLNLESGELERMEKEVTQIDLQGAEAIRLYSTLLKAYPDYPRNDQVLYQLARAYETTGQQDQALATLDDVVRRFPGSPQLDEVQFRRGEILFSEKRYREAKDAYAAVVARGRGKSSFYEQSLYKHGWSLFKQLQNEESLPSFGGVLDSKLVDRQGGFVDMQKLSRPDRELVDDTLRVMAVTFSYLEGPDSLDAFMAKRAPAPYAHLLYSRLGDLYVEKQRFQDAATVYRSYATRYPTSDFAPELATQAIEAYRRGGFAQLVLDGKREFVERYGFRAPFWNGRDRARYASVVAELKTDMKDVATDAHATAQKTRRVEDYQQAARWYRDYLDSFPNDPDSAATNQLLAEALFDSRQYGEAVTEFARTAYDYPRSDKSAGAAYAGLVAYQKQEETLSGTARSEWHAESVEAGLKFAEAFPEHPDSAGVMTRAAQDIFAAHDLPRAIRVSEALLARQPPVDEAKQRIAWTIIGQSNFDLGTFDRAEAAWLKAREVSGGDAAMRTDLTERIAAAVYKQGEARRAAGDAAGAADDFLRVGRVAPDSKIRATAEYDAAAQLITLQQWDRAIGVLEGYRRAFPNGEYAADVTRKLAVAYSSAGRSGEAAAEFDRIAASPTEEPSVRREALMQSADLYEKAGDSRKATGNLEKFVAAYPRPVPDAVEVRQRLADFAAKQGDSGLQQRWLREIVRADADAGAERTDRTHYLAARAEIVLAAPARDAFRAIRLTQPLKRSLAAKRKALDDALGAYRKAADYGVAEVTTQATYEMAELYRTLGQDVMKSERPKGLDKEALEQYDLLLEEQAFPFEEQSIATHEINLGRIRDGVYDDWVKKSLGVLAQLKPVRYGKTEQTLDAATTLE